MTLQYFQEALTEARERHDLNYLHAGISFENNGDVLYSVSLTVIIDIDEELPAWGNPKCYEMVHIHNSKRSLKATIDEAVRRVAFDNGLPEYEDLPLIEQYALAESVEISDMIEDKT